MDVIPFEPEAEDQPPLRHEPYRSTLTRSPNHAPIRIPQTLTEVSGPSAERVAGATVGDLTRQHGGEPIGQRIFVSGRVLDDAGRPVPRTVVELWQANASGRYAHAVDRWNAPLDPNFTGAGRTITDDDGRYRFITIKPGAYPWGNHPNAWRPEHIHFSLFGPAFATRLVTQMYFPGDPLIAIDPIANALAPEARDRLVSRFDLETSQEAYALSYVFDIVLRGRAATPFEDQT